MQPTQTPQQPQQPQEPTPIPPQPEQPPMPHATPNPHPVPPTTPHPQQPNMSTHTNPYNQGQPTAPGYAPQAPQENPGKVIGIIGIVMFILFAPLGLVFSIISFVQSKKVRASTTLGLIGIILNSIAILLFVAGIAMTLISSQNIQERAQASRDEATRAKERVEERRQEITKDTIAALTPSQKTALATDAKTNARNIAKAIAIWEAMYGTSPRFCQLKTNTETATQDDDACDTTSSSIILDPNDMSVEMQESLTNIDGMSAEQASTALLSASTDDKRVGFVTCDATTRTFWYDVRQEQLMHLNMPDNAQGAALDKNATTLCQ